MTDLQDDLRDELSERARSAPLPPDFTDRVRAAVVRHERHRRVGSLALAAAVVVIVLGGATLALRAGGEDAPSRVVAGPGEDPGAGSWRPMPDGPLSPRDGALSFTVGDEVLIFGGRPVRGCRPPDPCPPSDTRPLTDGAAYNPTTRTWRPIADALAPIYSASAAVIGDRLYLWAEAECPPNEFCAAQHTEFVAYDVGDDEWTRPDHPVRPGEFLGIAATGDRIVGYHHQAGGDLADLVFTPATGVWTPLPVDPLQPGRDRVIVGHGDDIYLFSVPDTGEDYQAAVLESGSDTWQVLADSGVKGLSASWVPIEDQIVNPTPDGAWSAGSPGGVLDTATDTWRPLPQPPPEIGAFYELGGVIAGDRYLTSFGLVFDALTGTWTSLPRPDEVAEFGFTAAWAGDTLVVWGGTDGGEPTDAGATWTVGDSPDDSADPRSEEGAVVAPGRPTPEMEAALATGAPVVIDDGGDTYCVQHPNRGAFACGRLDGPDPAVSVRWDYQHGDGSIVVVDGQRRLDRLEVLDAAGVVFRTIDAERDGLYLRASATRIPDTIRIVARDGTVLDTLHPIAMDAANREAVAASGDAAD